MLFNVFSLKCQMKASLNETMKLHNAHTISSFIVNETHFHWIREPKVNQNGLSMY